jgi:hypothetical protein
VAHTFTPRNIEGGVGTVVESTGVPIGDKRVTVSLNKTSTGRYKAVLKGVFPVVQDQVVNGITSPTVVRTAYSEIHFAFDERSTEQERKDVVGMMESALKATSNLTNGVFVSLEGIY